MPMHSHPIDAFGIEEVSLSGIRAEKLEARIKPKVSFPHKHDFFQLMLVTAGAGTHQIDFVEHPVSRGTIFLMKPGQMHSWKMKKGVSGLLVEFHYQSLNAFKESIRLMDDLQHSPDVLKVSPKVFEEALTLALQMLKETQTRKEAQDLALQGLLTIFLIHLMRQYRKTLRQDKLLSTVDKFKELVEKKFRQHHDVSTYAHDLRTSPKALTMQLSRSIGKAPRTIIQERILLEAKRFLAFSQLSIAEIGYELGFEDANYFTRFFRIHEKKSPATFRKESRLSQ
ncbi:MAG: helix-turn-helix domain-containing protein [Bacteriovoracaceae bacterium]